MMPMVLAEIPGFVIGLAVVAFIIVSVMMMLVVLIQKPQGGGLSGAFGAASDGAGQTAFGARTGDALTIATITIFIVFLLISIGLNYIVKPPEAQPQTTIQGGETTPSPAQPEGAVTPPATEQEGRNPGVFTPDRGTDGGGENSNGDGSGNDAGDQPGGGTDEPNTP